MFKDCSVVLVMEISDELAEKIQARDLAKSGIGRGIRKQAGLSLRQVAKEIRVSAPSVLNWENGRVQPKSPGGLRWAALMRRLLDES